MLWLRRGQKDHLIAAPPPWAATLFTKLNYPETFPILHWMPLEMGHPQLLWAICSSVSPHSELADISNLLLISYPNLSVSWKQLCLVLSVNSRIQNPSSAFLLTPLAAEKLPFNHHHGFLWTCSNSFTSSHLLGPQTWMQYSRWGLRRAGQRDNLLPQPAGNSFFSCNSEYSWHLGLQGYIPGTYQNSHPLVFKALLQRAPLYLFLAQHMRVLGITRCKTLHLFLNIMSLLGLTSQSWKVPSSVLCI